MSSFSRARFRFKVGLLLALAGGALAVILVGTPAGPAGPPSAASASVDGRPDTPDMLPDGISYTTFAGERVILGQPSGLPMLINFFSSTCVACVEEMPALQTAHERFGDRVAFLGLAVADRSEEAVGLVRQTGVTFPTAQDRDGSALTDLGGVALPTTVLIAPDGHIAAVYRGRVTLAELGRMLDRLVSTPVR